MNQFCSSMRDLKISVPTEIISAFYEALEFCKASTYNKSLQENWNYYSWYLQDINPTHKKLLQDPKWAKNKGLPDLLSHLKAYDVWIEECPAIVKIKEFITSHFSSCFHTRIANLPGHERVHIHEPHAWPRIFIPLHENQCEFTIVDNGVHKAYFEVGSMYLFDVRKLHGTHNLSDIDRYMGAFYIDPRIETITNIEVS